MLGRSLATTWWRGLGQCTILEESPRLRRSADGIRDERDCGLAMSGGHPLAQMESVVLADGPVLLAADQAGSVWRIPVFRAGVGWTCCGGQALAPPLALAASESGLAIAALDAAALLQVWVRGRWERWIAPPGSGVGFVALAAATRTDGVAHVLCISGSGQLWDLAMDGRDELTAAPTLPVSLVWVAAAGTSTGIVVLAR